MTQKDSPRASVARQLPVPTASKLPRWRGFNLLEMFYGGQRCARFREEDFQLIAEWGFDFVRLPLSYHCWAKPTDWLNIDEKIVEYVDEAVRFGQQYGIHVNVNLHRAPGYCVNPPAEPLDIWTDDKALDAAAQHWGMFARRYKGIPNSQVSFNLLNEPASVTPEKYLRVAKGLVRAIRAEDPDRLIGADGTNYGRTPMPILIDLKIAQSTRGYDPIQISHWKAGWMHGQEGWAPPAWPYVASDGSRHDRNRLYQERIKPWKELEAKGVGIHVGEWGAFHLTPHDVTLAWMRDLLDLWRDAGWGWALWSFRGGFGILDSGRTDVQYENFRGHQLDRKMLEVLQQG